MGAVSILWQLLDYGHNIWALFRFFGNSWTKVTPYGRCFASLAALDMWNKECQFLAEVFLRIFLAMPVIDPSHPAATSCVESQNISGPF
jgi:hypothetical protein